MTREAYINEYAKAHFGDNLSMQRKLAELAGSVYDAKYANVVVVDDDLTLTEEDSGKVFIVTADAKTITLPATFTGRYTFINGGADAAVALTISPAAADAIFGSVPASAGGNADATTADGLVSKASGTDNKDIVNTKATANKGDRITLVGDGSTGWFIAGGVGVWASEA